jgi:ferredoxin
MCSNISATTACGEYISVSCHVFIDRGLLPTMKLQNQGSLDIKMKSSLAVVAEMLLHIIPHFIMTG